MTAPPSSARGCATRDLRAAPGGAQPRRDRRRRARERGRGAARARSRPPRSGGEAPRPRRRRHRPARRGQVDAALRARGAPGARRGRTRRGARRRPVLEALGRRAARRPRADRGRPRRPRRFIRSMAAGERLGGLAPATRAAAQALAAAFDVVVIETVGVGQSRDRGRRGRRHRRRGRPARLGRRAPVPQGRDHGGPRRARRDQGRPRRRRAARARATCARRCARSAPRDAAVVAVVLDRRRSQGIDELVGGARRAPRAGSTSPARRAARAAPSARWPTSSPSTASAGLRALGGRRAAERALAEQTRAPTCPPSSRPSRAGGRR